VETTGAPSLADVEAAAARIAGWIRRTPLLHAAPSRQPLAGIELSLKLENLQVTGSFKARGAANKVLSLDTGTARRGLVTASGGNHGIAVAYAGWRAGVPTTVFLPGRTPVEKQRAIERWGATVERCGDVWDDAHAAALEFAAAEDRPYLHPFADAAIVAGQGTLALEVLADQPACELLVVAIGGAGLISGVALAAKSRHPRLRVVGVEPVGAPTLYASLAAGRLVTLPAITTAALTLAPRQSAQLNFDLVRRHVDEIVLVDDDEMRDAARWLWQECGVAAELSGAAAVAALRAGKIAAPPRETCAIVCGMGTDGLG
jgi:threonine dehydratase